MILDSRIWKYVHKGIHGWKELFFAKLVFKLCLGPRGLKCNKKRWNYFPVTRFIESMQPIHIYIPVVTASSGLSSLQGLLHGEGVVVVALHDGVDELAVQLALRTWPWRDAWAAPHPTPPTQSRTGARRWAGFGPRPSAALALGRTGAASLKRRNYCKF